MSDLNFSISPIDNVVSSGIDILTILAPGLSDADTLRVEVKSKEPESTEVLLEVESGFFLIRFGMPPLGIVIPVIYVLPHFPLIVVLPLNDTGTSLKAFLLLILTNFGRK